MYSQDLVFATTTIGTLSVLAFLLGSRVRSNFKSLFIFTILTAVGFSNWFQGNLGWANLLPHSSTVQLSNLTPILVAFIGGFACYGMELGRRARPVVVSTLALLSVVCLVSPIIRPAIAPPTVNPVGESKDFVVLQSHDATCAPASAATLLTLNGIQSNEAEMIGPCLTSEFGTEALGLYRGIKIGCEGSHFRVGVASQDPHHWAETGQLPNVALVRFPAEEFESSVSQSQIQSARPSWFSGNRNTEDGHAVVVVDYKDGLWTIADPAIGLVTWSDAELKARFTGEAIYLFRK